MRRNHTLIRRASGEVRMVPSGSKTGSIPTGRHRRGGEHRAPAHARASVLAGLATAQGRDIGYDGPNRHVDQVGEILRLLDEAPSW